MSHTPEPKSFIRALLNRTTSILETIASVLIVIMMLLTFVDVVGRYLLSAPIFGATEMVSALLALIIFSGLGVTNARDQHIVVELFDIHIRRLSPRIYDLLIHGFSVFAMALIAYVLAEHALEGYHVDSRTVVLEMPTYYITGLVALFAVVSVISQIIGITLKLHDHNYTEAKT